MSNYILALDQGTTSSRAIVFDKLGNIISIAQKEFTQFFPKPGWVEHDAMEIWETQKQVAIEALQKANIAKEQLVTIGITNQRETTVVWDRQTGQPIYNAIVWQDRRTAQYCTELKNTPLASNIKHKTGLVIDAYFSATKLKWVLENVATAKEKALQGKLCFGTIDSWLVYNLTKGKQHITDVSNASRTMLCNIHTLNWDEELLTLFQIPKTILPTIKSSSEVYGFVDAIEPLQNIPISGIAGDQQAALFGQMCTQQGMIKNTYGTGCFMLMNTGTSPIFSKHNLLTTVAWKIKNVTHYALEGSVFVAGAVVQWLRDGLNIISTAQEIEQLANEVSNNGGVYFVPAFVGLGTPHWQPHATGTITGITRGSTKAHIARAAVESIAFQTTDVLFAMQQDSSMAIKELRVDGGAAKNNLLMQFQSNVLNTTVVRPTITETTALGAAYLAGLAIGFWDNIQTIEAQWQVQQKFNSEINDEERSFLLQGWKKAIKATLV